MKNKTNWEEEISACVCVCVCVCVCRRIKEGRLLKEMSQEFWYKSNKFGIYLAS